MGEKNIQQNSQTFINPLAGGDVPNKMRSIFLQFHQ